MLTHSPVEIRLKELAALRQYADSFLLPTNSKKALTGSGNTYSPFKSRGLDFQEVRVYQPGDDIRQIDWHVTAKYGKPFTKLYTEEKDRTIFFIVDLRSSMQFATHGDFKSVIAARLAAFTAFVANHQKDKIGYLLLTDKGLISSGPSETGLLDQFLNALANPTQIINTSSDFETALHALVQLLPTGSFVFFFSDFHDWEEKDTSLLVPFSEKNTFLFVSIYDALEEKIPNDTLAFSNGNDTLILSAQNKKARQKFSSDWKQSQQALQNMAIKYGWGFLPLITHTDYLALFTRFCFGESYEHTN